MNTMTANLVRVNPKQSNEITFKGVKNTIGLKHALRYEWEHAIHHMDFDTYVSRYVVTKAYASADDFLNDGFQPYWTMRLVTECNRINVECDALEGKKFL